MSRFYELMNEISVRSSILRHAHNYEELASTYPPSMTLKDIKESLMDQLLKIENRIRDAYIPEESVVPTNTEPSVDEAIFASHTKFLEYLGDSVAKRWVNEFPQYFLCCNTTDEEVYNTCLQSPYIWYIKFRNGELYQRNYKITDADKHRGVDVVAQRKMLYHEMMSAPDIRIWTLENYRI